MPQLLPPAAAAPARTALVIVLAEDHALVRDGMKLLLSSMFPQVSFLDADDAVSLIGAMAHQPPPQLALVDLNMPGMERGEALQEILSRTPNVPVVVVSGLDSPDLVRRCLNLPSVWGFLSKNASAGEMRAAIEASLAGGRPGLVQFSEKSYAADSRLSPRLEEMRGLLRLGMTNKSIAQQLNISEGTVKNYMSELFKQLNVTNRTQAARFTEELK